MLVFTKTITRYLLLVVILLELQSTALKGSEHESSAPSKIIVKNEGGRDLGYRDPSGICPFTLEVDSQTFPIGNPVYIRVTFENTTDSYAWIPVFPLEFAKPCDAYCFLLTNTGMTLPWMKFPTEGMGLGGRMNPWRQILPGEKEVHYLELAIPRPRKTYAECFDQVGNFPSDIRDMEEFMKWNSVFQQGVKGRIGVTISTFIDAVDYGPQWANRINQQYPTDQEKVDPEKIDFDSKEYYQKLDFYKLRGKELTVFTAMEVTLAPSSHEYLVDFSKLCDSSRFHAALRGSVYDSKLCLELDQLAKKMPEGTLKNRLKFYQAYFEVYRLFDMKAEGSLIMSHGQSGASLKYLDEQLNSFPEIEREFYKRTYIPALVYYVKRRAQAAEETLTLLQNRFLEKEVDSEWGKHQYMNSMKEAWSSYMDTE